MGKKILKKIYLKIEFENQSPLAIGGGLGDLTDQTVLRDSQGNPYIPGSALAGVYRRLFSPDDANLYFGPERTINSENEEDNPDAENNQKMEESQVVTYDAMAKNTTKIETIIRDMVALDEFKVSKYGAKFDLEAVHPGTMFVTYVEWNVTDENYENPLDRIASAFQAGEVCIGSKTGRGYGQIKAVSMYYAEFNLQIEKGIKQWLEFSMYQELHWKKYEEIKQWFSSKVTIRLKLKQVGGIAIRKYSTAKGEADYEQLTIKKETEKDGQVVEIPVIPGTSWAGAFRAQIARFNDAAGNIIDLEKFFGRAKAEATDSQKSRIGFSESQIEGAQELCITRNAIDRFTNATVDGALYTEKTWYQGNTDLVISLDKESMRAGKRPITQKEQNSFYAMLSAAIADLHEGYLSVGGLTAVGRGLFHIECVTIRYEEMQIKASLEEIKRDVLNQCGDQTEKVNLEKKTGEILYRWFVKKLPEVEGGNGNGAAEKANN